MVFYYINSTNRSNDVKADTLRITNQIQQRADTCTFDIFKGTKPNENQDVQIFLGDTIASAASATIVLNGYYEQNVSRFYTGQKLHIRIGDADEEIVEVLTYTESTSTIVLTAAPSGTVTAGDKIGELIFGGVVSRVRDHNVDYIANIEYDVTCVDYTKIFDKKLIADTWEDVDSRYIINSFRTTTVNYATLLDNMAFADNTAIQAEWMEGGDGGNPTVDLSDFMESTASAVFGWTFSGGTAYWEGSPTSKDLTTLTGAATGQPVAGLLECWIEMLDYTKVTSFKIRIGSDSSNYSEFTFTLQSTNDWQYLAAKAVNTPAPTGTPDWGAVDYVRVIVGENASSSIKINGIRFTANGSFTMYNVHPTNAFDDFRAPQIKPTVLMQTLSKSWNFIWFIDYERDINFLERETTITPFNLTDSSGNFTDLQVEVDQSQIANRIIISGGERTSTNTYAQVFRGDSTLREWVLKNKFNNLTILLDNNTSTDTMEATTTTTTVKATGHGLTVGDHVVMRSRNSVVREVLTVPDADTFTVEAVPSQASGDTFSKFATAKTVGYEGLDDEASFDYMANSNEKSVRNSSQTTTLTSTDFIRFSYNERVPLQLQYTNSASINALKALGFGDGIFDADPITDRNIQDTRTAIALAEAKINEFSNPLILGSFQTDQHGLRAGSLIRITDSVGRNIDESYVLQRVTAILRGGKYKDYFIYGVDFGTTLFGVIEFYQKLLKTKDGLEQNSDAIVETFVTSDEDIETDDVNQTATDGGFETATGNETVETADTNIVYDTTVWKWEVSTGQPLETRWDLFQWS